MATPPKPWEKPGVNSHNFDTSTFKLRDEFRNNKTMTDLSDSTRRVPPPLPLRPASSANHYRPMYNNYYSPYSSLYNSYGMRNSMFSDLGYNNYGIQNDNRIMQFAQDSTRPAFQSIESIIQAVTSISMMLESTYQAVHSSFFAVLGVADHFSRLKSHFLKIYSAFALWRALKWIYHKILVLLRLQKSGFSEEIAWKEIFTAQDKISSEPSNKRNSLWPLFLFCAITFGGPWLIWRLVSSILDSNKGNPPGWVTGVEDHFIGLAQYDFDAENDNEISFRNGQELHIAPKELQPRVRGWLLASIDGEKSGLVPANYIQVLGKKQCTENVGES